MRAVNIFSLFLISGLISSCGTASPSRVVVLQHPKTMQTVECRVDPLGHIIRSKQIDDCVSAYRQAGYSPVGDSANEYNKPK
jgi:hypothetical protein